MLHLHHGNRLERHLERLARITTDPLPDPFEPERVVVQNQGMGRWIAQRLAERNGICANLQFPLPARFFWDLLDAWLGDLPRESAFDRESLLWRLMALLPGQLDDPAFAEPRRYLAEGPVELKRYQLCRRVADLFDQYLVYRPEWILAWERGEEDHWQARLWRVLREHTEGPHRAGLLARLRETLAEGRGPAGVLPGRVSFFGLTALAPAYLEMLGALGERSDVHLFLLEPSREYWADLVPERERARRRAHAFRSGRQDTTALLDVGNPLLASMGHAGQELLDLLLELPAQDHDDFVAPLGEGLLARVQRDILDLVDRRQPQPQGRKPLQAQDASLSVHVCHGRMREVQVLHDRLLRAFDELDGLQPRDVVVMAPDIDAYAPYVDAVFGAAEGSRAIPWSISDRRAAAQGPLPAAFLQLLRLPASRLAASEVAALLEVPALQRRFGLDAPAVERLRTWVRESAIRWGADADMRVGLGLPGEDAGSWAFGLRRLFLGYALPSGQELWGSVAPYPDLEGSEAVHLGALQEAVERLSAWREKLVRPAAASAWQERVNALLRDFFDPDADEATALRPVREAAERLSLQARAARLDEPLPLEVVRAWLESALDEPGGAGRFLAGRVTFCNLVPMRSIPFRVVCLLGLNDTELPRDQRPVGFDLMARAPRRGDRSRRRDDRYLFLEAILSARERLHLSYVGRDQRDDSEKVPSVLLGELLEYIDRSFRGPDGGDARDLVTVHHPLQPFSPRCFDGSDPRLASYAADWLSAARSSRAEEAAPFADVRLPAPDSAETAEIELDALIRFLRNPAAAFLEERLGVRLPGEEDALEDSEPFIAAGLEKYDLRRAILEQALAGADSAAVQTLLRARGGLPHGVVGDLVFAEHAQATDDFIRRLRPRLGEPGEALEVDLRLPAGRLRGWLPTPVDNRLVSFRFGKLSARDRLCVWVHHLAYCAVRGAGAGGSIHVAADKTLSLVPVADARGRLADLLDLRWQGLCEPVAFFPETSLAWAEKGEMSGKVAQAWAGDRNLGAESLDPANAIAWRGRDPLALPEFGALGARVWAPFLSAAELTGAAKDRP